MDAPDIHSQEEQEQVPQKTPTRKRQIDSDDGREPRPKRTRLTRENLALFDTKGGKKKSSNPTDDSTTTKSISTTTSGFAIQAYENGMLDPRHSKAPKNLENIDKRHARSRATASPPESRYRNYVNRVKGARNEATMVHEVSRHMLKEYDDDEGYKKTFNQAFTGFPKDAGFNKGLSAPQPDFVEGLEMQEYRPFPVHKHVSGAVLYKDDPNSLTLPHLAGEWKGPDGSMAEAGLQARYYGATLVYARNQALAYLGKPDPPGHAEVTTFTTDGTNLNFYAHYAAQSEDGTLEYHQYQYASANVKDSHQGHKDGRRGLRNVQDHARKQSGALRDQLKEHWKQQPAPLPTIIDEEGYEVSTQQPPSTHETDYEAVEPPPAYQPEAPTSSKPPKKYKRSSSHSYSTRSSTKIPQLTHDHTSSSSHKKKSSHTSHSYSHKSSGHTNKHKSY